MAKKSQSTFIPFRKGKIEVINRDKNDVGLSDERRVLNSALTHWGWVTQKAAEGKLIVAVDPVTGHYSVLLMPELVSLQRKS